MAKEPKRIDISAIPELLNIAEEVRTTKESRLLKRDGEDLALITPVRPVARRIRRGRPTDADDPLWNIVGMASSPEPTDASKKHEYLADAYAPQKP